MRGYVPPDPETTVSEVQCAVVYVPRRSRKRFSHGCVEIMQDAETACYNADPGQKRYAAKVLGPSKSAEGQYLFYLVEWLTDQQPE